MVIFSIAYQCSSKICLGHWLQVSLVSREHKMWQKSEWHLEPTIVFFVVMTARRKIDDDDVDVDGNRLDLIGLGNKEEKTNSTDLLFFIKGAVPGLSFLFLRLFQAVNNKYVHFKSWPMAGYETWTSGNGRNRSANWATTTACGFTVVHLPYTVHKVCEESSGTESFKKSIQCRQLNYLGTIVIYGTYLLNLFWC